MFFPSHYPTFILLRLCILSIILDVESLGSAMSESPSIDGAVVSRDNSSTGVVRRDSVGADRRDSGGNGVIVVRRDSGGAGGATGATRPISASFPASVTSPPSGVVSATAAERRRSAGYDGIGAGLSYENPGGALTVAPLTTTTAMTPDDDDDAATPVSPSTPVAALDGLGAVDAGIADIAVAPTAPSSRTTPFAADV